MQVVTQNTAVWWQGGVAATDVAALVGCGAESKENPVEKWAQKTWSRERPLRKTTEREWRMRKLPEMEQGTKPWHDFRKQGLGGSEAAVVVGASYDYGNKTSPWKTFAEKTSESTGEAENENTARGKRLEPEARGIYEQLMDWSAPPLCVIHDDHDCVRCSLDGLRSDDKVVLEVKCPRRPNHEKSLRIQTIADPLDRQRAFAAAFDYYRAQVQYQLLITGAELAHFVSYNTDFADHNRFAMIELYPEPVAQEELLKRALEFWDCVVRREPPSVEWCVEYDWGPPTELRLPAV